MLFTLIYEFFFDEFVDEDHDSVLIKYYDCQGSDITAGAMFKEALEQFYAVCDFAGLSRDTPPLYTITLYPSEFEYQFEDDDEDLEDSDTIITTTNGQPAEYLEKMFNLPAEAANEDDEHYDDMMKDEHRGG